MATNLLEAVTTYNEAGLAALDNLSPYIYYANKKYIDWERQLPQQLGDTIDIALPTRFSVNTSLVANFQSIEQRKQPLEIKKQYSTSYAFTSQELDNLNHQVFPEAKEKLKIIFNEKKCRS